MILIASQLVNSGFESALARNFPNTWLSGLAVENIASRFVFADLAAFVASSEFMHLVFLSICSSCPYIASEIDLQMSLSIAFPRFLSSVGRSKMALNLRFHRCVRIVILCPERLLRSCLCSH